MLSATAIIQCIKWVCFKTIIHTCKRFPFYSSLFILYSQIWGQGNRFPHVSLNLCAVSLIAEDVPQICPSRASLMNQTLILPRCLCCSIRLSSLFLPLLCFIVLFCRSLIWSSRNIQWNLSQGIDIKTIDGSRWHGRPVGFMLSYLRFLMDSKKYTDK